MDQRRRRAKAFALVNPSRFLPLVVGAVLAVVATKVWVQVGHPFLEHDDWDFLLPADAARRHLQFERLRTEGRWLNYLWWRGPGHLLTPLTAVLLFELAALVTAARLAWRWAPGWLAAPALVALFAAPMVSDLTYWPATIGPSMLLIAIAACTATWAAAHPVRLVAWLGVLTFLAFLSYPTSALVIYVIVMIELLDRPFRELVRTTIAFGVAYAAGTAGVLGLNRIAFGTFHIEIRPWRNPNELHDLGDLGENLRRVAEQLSHLVGRTTIPVGLAALAVLGCLLVGRHRDQAVRLLLVGLVAFAVQSSTTVLTGVATPFRSTWWIWVLLVVPFVWLAREPGNRRWIRVTAVVGLVAVGLWGARAWQHDVDRNQHRLRIYDRINERLAAVVAEHPGDRVLIYGSAQDWSNPDFTQEAQYLSLKAYDDHGTRITNCQQPDCDIARRPAVIAAADAGAKVIVTGSFILVVPSAHRR